MQEWLKTAGILIVAVVAVIFFFDYLSRSGDARITDRDQVRADSMQQYPRVRREDSRRTIRGRGRERVRRVVIDGPAERGSATEYCFRQKPHWQEVIARYGRDRCIIDARHGRDGTHCRMQCL